MAALLIVLGLAFVAYRVMSRFGPAAKKVLSWGDDIGGWTIAWKFGGEPAKQWLSGGARFLMYFVAVILAIFWQPARICFVVWLAFKVWRWWAAKDVTARKLAASGFSSEVERKVIAESVTQALLAMNLGSKTGDEIVPPRCWNWRKLPVLVGGKPLAGQWRYECLIEPAPGKSVAQLQECAARGLDADYDGFRDTVNQMLRAARGREVKQLRAERLVPTFTLSTCEQVTRKGEKIGLGRLTLWTTDPFSREVRYPYDPARPRVQHFTDPVPVGLLRSNVEARMQLAKHTSVQGINGSGKSSVVRPAMVAAAHTDAIIIVIALKGPADYAELRERFAGATIITKVPDALRVLRSANDEIQRRNHLDPATRAALPHVWIVLDEGQELGDEIGVITPIVKKGRSAKVWLWSVTQYGITSIIPSEAAREMGQRYAGRIEGTANQAVVAVGSRANKTRGPHLIPEAKKWVGVLFGSDGNYLRVYWVSEEGPKSRMARCARGCPQRPADPAWFVEALNARDGALPPLELPSFPDDGARRSPSGEARSFDVNAVPEPVKLAVERAWAVAGKTMPEGTVTAGGARKVLTSAEKRLQQRTDPDLDDEAAVDLVQRFLSMPLVAAPTSQEADNQ